jgi:hypothetical protein
MICLTVKNKKSVQWNYKSKTSVVLADDDDGGWSGM